MYQENLGGKAKPERDRPNQERHQQRSFAHDKQPLPANQACVDELHGASVARHPLGRGLPADHPALN